MTETGIVKRIGKDVVTVECSATPRCEGCAACSAAGGRRTMEAVNRSGSELKEGDVVEVHVAAAAAVQASFLVLILPLALLIAFYFLVQKLAPTSPEGVRVAVGVGGLGVGFGLNLILRGKHREYPEIVGVKESTEATEA